MESSHPSCRNVFQVHQCIDPLKVERTEYPSWITQVLAFESPIGLIKYPSFDMARRSTVTNSLFFRVLSTWLCLHSSKVSNLITAT